AVFGAADTLPPAVPVGFLVLPAGVSITPTSISFSPDGGTLYAASLTGFVFSHAVIAGALLGPPIPFLSGLSQPLGVLATEHGVFVSVARSGRGAVLRARDTNGDGIADVTDVVLSDLPIGRHNTNGLAIGPDGMLYVSNGNSNDSGFRAEGGPPHEPPFSGSLLRVDPTASNLEPDPEMVVGTGWRNNYDVAFVPEGHPSLPAGLAAVTMNGPDGMSYGQPGGGSKARPTGEDTLSFLDVTDDVVEHFGFPWCLYDRSDGGLAGFTQDPEEGDCADLPAAAFAGFPIGPLGDGPQIVVAKPATLFGTHVSADGLAFNSGGSFPAEMNGDLFVAEFGNYPGPAVIVGHKVVRVRFGEAGEIAAVDDFLSAVLPVDLSFAPDGSLWVAELS
ncbi:MAG: PQQ-dependent sugar dehydrogenase, partial [Candidatus Binatia bacterium]